MQLPRPSLPLPSCKVVNVATPCPCEEEALSVSKARVEETCSDTTAGTTRSKVTSHWSVAARLEPETPNSRIRAANFDQYIKSPVVLNAFPDAEAPSRSPAGGCSKERPFYPAPKAGRAVQNTLHLPPDSKPPLNPLQRWPPTR